MSYELLSEREEELGRIIVDCAYTVHRKLGPGLLEKVYEACFCYELKKRGVKYERQVDFPIPYDDTVLDEGLRLDVFVDDLVICEIKAVEKINPLWYAQVLSHVRLIKRRLGFLINFNVLRIKDGIKRIIN